MCLPPVFVTALPACAVAVIQSWSVKSVLEVCFSLQLYEKEALAKVFSYDFCEILKNTCLYRTPPLAASVFS